MYSIYLGYVYIKLSKLKILKKIISGLNDKIIYGVWNIFLPGRASSLSNSDRYPRP